MYVGRLHTGHAEETLDVEYHCRWCGHRQWARARAAGVAAKASHYMINDARARDRAAVDAVSDAMDIAAASLAHVPCPKCGKRNAERDALSPLVVIAGPLALGGALGFALGATLGAELGALAGAAVGAVSVWARKTRAANASMGVVFFEGEPPDRPFVGQRCKVCDKQVVTAEDGGRCQRCGAALHHRCSDKHAKRKHPKAKPGTSEAPAD